MPTLTLYPGANSDDCFWSLTGSEFYDTLNIPLNASIGTNLAVATAIRFPGVNIPQGATISSAVLTFTAETNTSNDTVNLLCYCNDVDNAVAPTTRAQGLALALTEANVAWNSVPHWTDNSTYNTPELAAAVQEVINRTGWVSGNALMFVIKNNGGATNAPRYFHSHNTGESAKYTKLVITYSSDTIISLAQNPLSSMAGLNAGTQQQLTCQPLTGQASLSLSNINIGYFVDCGPLQGQSLLTAILRIDLVPDTLISLSQLSLADLQLLISPPVLPGSGQLILADMTTFIDRDYRITYRCVLTGSPDIILPMSSFQARFRNGEPSFLSVVIPGMYYAEDIADRSSGDLQVYMIKTYRDGNQIAEMIGSVNLDDIRIDEGGVNQSITLSGYKTETHALKTINLAGASYRNIYAGLKRYRCQPNLYLRPGDTVIVNGETFQADVITWAIGIGTEIMEVAEE
jgi:hypothetical protein